jgi:hypothetical protein
VVVLKLQAGCNFATMKQAPHGAENQDSCGSGEGSISMKTHSNNKRVFTDDIYHVAAVDLADKLIERMRCGLGPILLV